MGLIYIVSKRFETQAYDPHQEALQGRNHSLTIWFLFDFIFEFA